MGECLVNSSPCRYSRGLCRSMTEWLFELEYDGFRALAVIEHGRAQLISRNGNPFA